MIRVSFQGERGAYSEEAALSYFKEEIQTIPLSTFAEVLEYAVCGKSDYAILPVENSIEGSVGESYDLLHSTPLKIVGEIYHKIEHCLIGIGKLEDIDTVYSHPQALGQCRRFLQKNNFKTIPTYDTAGSVKIIKEINKKNVACIASRNAAVINNIPVIMQNIADNHNNFTRFLILSQNSKPCKNNCKTSIIFSIKHEPGALYKVLEKFQKYNINLTKIESRPKKETPWEYIFYVDFETDSNILELLDKVKEDTLFMKVLGTYNVARQ